MTEVQWVKDWQSEDAIEITPKLIEWMKSRPASVKELMLRFPPHCLVRANRSLVCPALGTIGIVFSYLEDGSMMILQDPDSMLRAQCEADWLEVVGYRKGMTLLDVQSILMRAD